jgi:sugar phosphate isomerase/epimerase
MRFAFSTAIDPSWDLSAVTATAQSLGYDGVEVYLPAADREGDPAAGSPLAERDIVRLAFERAGVAVAGVATSLHYAGDAARDAATADAVRRVIDLAGRVRAGRVRMLDAVARPGTDRGLAGLRYADWLVPLADHAAAAGVTLLVQSALSHRTAGRMWRLIEQADHPALAVAWDPLAAALAGETAAVAVPTLNSRIGHVLIRDGTLVAADGDGRQPSARGPAGAVAAPSNATARPWASFARVGDGELGVRDLLNRLSGIGFDGWASVSYPPPLATGLGSAEDLLRHALDRMKGWLVAPKPAGRSATAARVAPPTKAVPSAAS